LAIFISHSFENKPEFDNIADALVRAGVPFWNPNEVKPGSSLRDQLRQAVDHCSVCVFIATHRALESSWCGAELGAFWGAGKPVIVYLSDSSLKEDDLPPLVQGDVWERRISRAVARAGELVKEAASSDDKTSNHGSTHVGAMTVEQLERLIMGAVSLAAAGTKSGPNGTTPEEIGRVAKDAADTFVESIQATQRSAHPSHEGWRKHILWVDDRPNNNVHERRAFESMGIEFTLALSTKEALEILPKGRFGAIISDMGRKEGPREGYALLDAIRTNGDGTPFFIYAGSNAPIHKREAEEHGGQGSTNNPQELFSMVTRVLGLSNSMPDESGDPELLP
jgi:CheY-like chemotaxis protein